jgi:hypothetical protein
VFKLQEVVEIVLVVWAMVQEQVEVELGSLELVEREKEI